MTDLTPGKRDELRAACNEGFTVGHDEWLDLSATELLALLDAADERDRLAAQVRTLAEWHETKAMKARHYRSGMIGQNVVMDKAASVHDDAARRLRRALDADA